jgi:hypothetical protein
MVSAKGRSCVESGMIVMKKGITTQGKESYSSKKKGEV